MTTADNIKRKIKMNLALLSKHAVATSNHTTIGYRKRGGDHIVVKVC